MTDLIERIEHRMSASDLDSTTFEILLAARVEIEQLREELECLSGQIRNLFEEPHDFPVANGAIGDTCLRCGVKRDAVR